jgi:hypothetical protein
VEITSVLQEMEKIEKYIAKKKVVEKIYRKPFRGFFVCGSSNFNQEKKADVISLLRAHGSELINL